MVASAAVSDNWKSGTSSLFSSWIIIGRDWRGQQEAAMEIYLVIDLSFRSTHSFAQKQAGQ
jgi:hypothetical protein